MTRTKAKTSLKAAKAAKDTVKRPNSKPPTAPLDGFSVGDKIVHAQFGAGKIVAIDGERLSIKFVDGQLKVIVPDFVKRAK